MAAFFRAVCLALLLVGVGGVLDACFEADGRNGVVRLARECDSALRWLQVAGGRRLNVSIHRAAGERAADKRRPFELRFRPDCVLRVELEVDRIAAVVHVEQAGGPRVLFGLPFRVEATPAGLTVRSRSGSTLKQPCRVDFEAAPGGWRLLAGFWAAAPFSDLDVLYLKATLYEQLARG
ncbi:hypothetical protein M3Y99_00748200 [Aphelenchoides fujianensis]|nr:hypothetical protein M3Y99_00748200 [Aphelenchoides fujianensis]